MASTSGFNSVGLVTCPTCNYCVPQATGKKRTICPNCGNFYSKADAEIATTYQRNRKRGVPDRSRRGSQESKEGNNRNSQQEYTDSADNEGGRLNTISNFFQNLGNRRSNRESRSNSSSSTDHPHSPRGVRDLLPPIENGSRSQLTVPSRNHTPSYINNNNNVKAFGSPRHSRDSSPGGSNDLHQNPLHSSSHSSKDLQIDENSQHSNQNHNAYNRRCEDHQDRRQHLPSRLNSSQTSSREDFHSPGRNNIKADTVRTKNGDQLKAEFVSAKESGNWKTVLDFYSCSFNSFSDMNIAFKRDSNKEYKTAEDPGLKLDFVNLTYDVLIKTPQGLQKEVLKAIINSLLKDKRNHDGRIWPHTKDDLRAFFVLLQNPQFSNQTSYVIFAHLLRQVASLSDHDHHFLVHWLKRLKKERFQNMVERLHNFISMRLFPSKPEDLPPLAKCGWWIPSATKVLALLNAANNLQVPTIVDYILFYNSTLDHLDLMVEYYAWQNPGSSTGFSFCQYPFILSIAAKRTILQKDSEQQMIVMARKSLVQKVQRRQLPDIGMLFLNLTVRRSHLVSDSLNEIAKKQHDLKKKLKVSFAGEPGLDMGGLTKEWFLLLVRQIFLSNYGMFTYNQKAGVHWFSPNPCDNYQEFNLVGVLMGLAVYNSINLDIRFPAVCYRKLLSPAVVPFNNPKATVGICNVFLHDFKAVQPEVGKGLQELLDFDGDVEDVFCLNFEVSVNTLGTVKTVPLKPNGGNIPVTKDNKKEYVQLYVEWVLNTSIYSQFQAFYHGFHSVCASNALIMLRPEEVETLVCGSPTLVIKDLKRVTVYDGYTADHLTIRLFWDVVIHLPVETQKRLLLFATGSDRIPIGGISEMTFKISRIDDSDLLPMSHTCFNQLVLPPYKSKRILKQKLITAISNAEGFGLE